MLEADPIPLIRIMRSNEVIFRRLIEGQYLKYRDLKIYVNSGCRLRPWGTYPGASSSYISIRPALSPSSLRLVLKLFNNCYNITLGDEKGWGHKNTLLVS